VEGASRRALVTARARFDELTSVQARPGSGPDLDRVAGDLAAVADVLAVEIGLRRALGDPGITASSRVGLAERLFGGRIDPVSLDVVRAAVAQRWSRPLDLRFAIAELGIEAVLAKAQADGALDEVEDELFRFGRILDSAPRLALAFTDPALPLDRKESLVAGLLAEKAHPATVRLVQRALSETDQGDLERRLEAIARVAAARRDRVLAVVRSARPLDDDQVAGLRASISRYFGRDIQLQVDVDPSLVGGVVVRVGDEVVDGSVVRRLADTRRRLLR
jgi:F-type H+-transporting ATPase subunit delta